MKKERKMNRLNKFVKKYISCYGGKTFGMDSYVNLFG